MTKLHSSVHILSQLQQERIIMSAYNSCEKKIRGVVQQLMGMVVLAPFLTSVLDPPLGLIREVKYLCLKHIVAEKGVVLSYRSKTEEERRMTAAKKQKQRMKSLPDKPHSMDHLIVLITF